MGKRYTSASKRLPAVARAISDKLVEELIALDPGWTRADAEKIEVQIAAKYITSADKKTAAGSEILSAGLASVHTAIVNDALGRTTRIDRKGYRFFQSWDVAVGRVIVGAHRRQWGCIEKLSLRQANMVALTNHRELHALTVVVDAWDQLVQDGYFTSRHVAKRRVALTLAVTP